jgi:uncharacterized protein
MVMHAAPPTIDPVRFAREESHVTGVLKLDLLPRLADVLFDHEGGVIYAVAGYTTGNGQPALHIRLQANLGLRCQRCLERLPLQFDTERDVVLVAGAGEVAAGDEEDDDIDTIPGVASLDLLDLIEQEVVLSLPMAPRHAEDGCATQPSAAAVTVQDSPFSALAGLKSPPAGAKTH